MVKNKYFKKILFSIIMVSLICSKTFAFENENIHLLLKGFKEKGYIMDCDNELGTFFGENEDCMLEGKNEIIISEKINKLKIIKKGETKKYKKEIEISKYKTSEGITKELLTKTLLLSKGDKYIEKNGMHIIYKIEKIKGFNNDKFPYLDITILYKNTIFQLKGFIGESLKTDIKDYINIIKKLDKEQFYTKNDKYKILGFGKNNIYFINKTDTIIVNYDYFRNDSSFEIDKVLLDINKDLKTKESLEYYLNIYFKDKYKIISEKSLLDKDIIEIKNELDKYFKIN